MPTVQQLKDKRASVWADMTEIMSRADDEARELTGEETEQYDRGEKDLDALTAQIARGERHAERGREMDTVDRSDLVVGDGEPRSAEERNKPDAEGAAYRAAFDGFLRRGITGLTAEHQGLLQRGFVAGSELRAQGVVTDAVGGYTVPDEFYNRLIETQVKYDGIEQAVGALTTSTGADMPWPSVDDTANEGDILDENTQVAEQDITFGGGTLKAYVFTSKLVRVSLQLLQDSAVDAEGVVVNLLGKRLGRAHARKFTVGTGTGQPQGIVTGATLGKTGATGQTLTVTYDDLVDLEHSVDAAYRESGDCKWMFADTTLASLRKIKDADGRPLWQPSVMAGVADTFNGRSYVINPFVATMAANAKSIVFGNFKEAYVIRRVRNAQLLRLAERYADYLQVGFLAFDRIDGRVVDSAAVKYYKNSAT